MFDGELHQVHLLVVLYYFAVMFQAQNESFEWVTMKTNDNVMVSHFTGKVSALRGIPVET